MAGIKTVTQAAQSGAGAGREVAKSFTEKRARGRTR